LKAECVVSTQSINLKPLKTSKHNAEEKKIKTVKKMNLKIKESETLKS